MSSLDQIIQDLYSKYYIGAPQEVKSKTNRLFSELQNAYYYYEDKIRPNTDLKHFKSNDEFLLYFWSHTPLKAIIPDIQTAITRFHKYLHSIPSFGCIMLSSDLNQVVLVEDYRHNTWSFPKGKQNQDEIPWRVAVREVQEETGVYVGKFIDKEDYIEEHFYGKQIRLYIIYGLSLDTKFNIVENEEIKDCKFFPLDNLPEKTFTVDLFLDSLRKHIEANKEKYSKKPVVYSSKNQYQNKKTIQTIPDEESYLLEQDENHEKGWSCEDMWKTNEQIIGRKFSYDGNPQQFGNDTNKCISSPNLLTSLCNSNTSNIQFNTKNTKTKQQIKSIQSKSIQSKSIQPKSIQPKSDTSFMISPCESKNLLSTFFNNESTSTTTTIPCSKPIVKPNLFASVSSNMNPNIHIQSSTNNHFSIHIPPFAFNMTAIYESMKA